MKVAIYIRVSSTRQVERGHSLESQEKILRRYCKYNKYAIYDVYSDKGISGKTYKNRAGLNQLLKDAEEKKFDMILIWKLNRFCRNFTELLTICNRLDELDIKLVSHQEMFDSSTINGRLVRNILASIAEWERENISENVKVGIETSAMKGVHTASCILGYDIKDNVMTINDKEAEIVQFLFDSYLKYKSLSEVMRLCHERSIKGKRGGQMTAQNLLTILECPVHAGFNRFNGLIIKGQHDAIISIDTYNKVQRLMHRQSKLTGRPRQKPITILK